MQSRVAGGAGAAVAVDVATRASATEAPTPDAIGPLAGSVFLWQTPLDLPGPFPARLAGLLPKHAVVLAECQDGGVAAFDFEPADKDSLVNAATLLSGGAVAGRFGLRRLPRAPRGAVRVGPVAPGADGDVVAALNASFDPSLSLWSNDCNTYATAVLGRVLANARASTGGRLFSTLDAGAMEKSGDVVYKEPSLLGAVVLVAGTTIGAGVLALPAVTQPVGFVPSSAALALAWVYMATTGLLLAEVALAEMASSGKRATSLQSMATKTIGPVGATLSSFGFVVVHFGLLVAYMSRGGQLLAEVLPGLAAGGLPPPVIFAAVFGGLIFATRGTDVLELFNNAAAAVVVVSFLALVGFAVPSAEPGRLLGVADWAHASDIAPTLLLSLVYHNVVPTVCAQLEGDRQKITIAVLLGSFVPLVMFVLWNGVILAAVPPGAASGADPLDVLRASGGSFLSFGVLAFSFSAIITSFVGFVLALTDFFADLFSPAGGREEGLAEKARNFALTLLPPLAVACYDPSIFFQAIDKAGAFGVSVLFGLLPALMSLAQRARDSPVLTETPGLMGGYVRGPLVPGGAAALALVAGGAIWVLLDNVLELLGAA